MIGWVSTAELVVMVHGQSLPGPGGTLADIAAPTLVVVQLLVVGGGDAVDGIHPACVGTVLIALLPLPVVGGTSRAGEGGGTLGSDPFSRAILAATGFRH